MKISKKDVETYFDPERRKCTLWGRAFDIHKDQSDATAWLMSVIEELAEIHQERKDIEIKFKVGDRVLCADAPKAGPGIIIDYVGNQYRVHWDDYMIPDPRPYGERDLIRA